MVGKNFQQGIYSQQMMGLSGQTAGLGKIDITSGHINPMLGSGERNTKTEQVQRISAQTRQGFVIGNVADSYFEDIVKGTYIKGETVYHYFLSFSQSQGGRTEVLNSSDFSRAIQSLGIGWTHNSTDNVFASGDQRMHQGARQNSLTAIQIDEAICLGCKSKFQRVFNLFQSRFMNFKKT